LQATLESLQSLDTGSGSFTYSITVADNDAAGSARTTVEAFAARSGLAVAYAIEPRQNISLARNLAASLATGELVAWLDDDECPTPGWLLHLYRTLCSSDAAGVLGPVAPVFRANPPAWITQGRFFHKPRRKTGMILNWHQTSTANVLLRRSLLQDPDPAFREEFGSGCEDLDFFKRMTQRGHTFVWCDEALVSEIVPPTRWHARYLFRRALLRGRNGARLSGSREFAKALVAIPIYSVLIPLLAPFGKQHAVRFLMKWGDHVGLLIGLFRLPLLGKHYLAG
jgi:cellulose synthase/poly-beta-1,6-N-acetylglucosamine synthase-like glycosyltransferase